ncbi:leucine-rich melanocyte differentiation-associated protein [Octopus sinensis]|uniref:Leucine-rich melanocyte differentiation-associated protein n=1 Tax=Octopus sinensis TaxID=2607531 RepID=A0A6P7U018_9MOLL|nr:leucine-rich melanocyte differentiation-associated protein [Octopus sinensis]
MMTNKGKPILPKNGEKSEKKKENIVFANGQLTYACNDVHVIPEKLIESFCTKTKRLDLSYNLLYTLKGLENFTDLEELVLDNNWIDDDTEFPALNSLHTLTLNKNNISDLESFLLKLKASYTNLKYLSLLGNNACPNQLSDKEKDDGDYQRYRYYVIYELKTLKFLDSTPIKDEEVKEALRIGQYMKVARPIESTSHEKYTESRFTPLPESKPGKNVRYGKSRYIYFGRHSEGNRYIKNNDL